MATVLDLGTAALRDIGVLAAGEVASADDGQSMLDALNRLVDQWAAEKLMIYTVTRTVWTIAASTQDYTIGTGGTVNVARPIYLDHINYQNTATSPTLELPLTKYTDDEWSQVKIKTLTATLPIACYYNPTFPLGTLSLWPVPTASTLQGVLYAPASVAEFTALSDSVSLPPGYRRLIEKNLAVELAPSYEREVSRTLYEQAADAKTVVKRSNKRLVEMRVESGALINSQRFSYNIRTDTA